MVSPYALLKASKPKTPASLVTPYDLYSTIQREPDTVIRQPEPLQAFDVRAAEPPVRKTHYIRDIGFRHSQALRHASFSQTPMD